jgi:hypothetical protein
VAFGPIKFLPGNKNEPPTLKIVLNRTGNQSIYGDINVKAIDSKNTEYEIAAVNGTAIYTPNTLRNLSIALRPQPGVDLTNKKIHVTFKEQQKSGSKLLAEADLAIP